MRTLYVYIVSTPSKRLSVGYTDAIRHDLSARNAGQVEMERLVYYETLSDSHLAVERFIELKTLPRSRKVALIQMLNPFWDDLTRQWQWSRARDSQA